MSGEMSLWVGEDRISELLPAAEGLVTRLVSLGIQSV